jgi:hypothetical protein
MLPWLAYDDCSLHKEEEIISVYTEMEVAADGKGHLLQSDDGFKIEACGTDTVYRLSLMDVHNLGNLCQNRSSDYDKSGNL